MGCARSKEKPMFPVSEDLVNYRFKWSHSGSILVKTMHYQAEYNPVSKETIIRLSDRNVTISRMIWQNGIYSLADLRTYDRVNKKTTKGPGLKLEFTVTPEGRFGDVLQADGILEQIRKTQQTSAEQAAKMQSMLLSDLRSKWRRWVELWLGPEMMKSKEKSCGKDCVRMEFRKEQNRVEEFLGKDWRQVADNFKIAEAGQVIEALFEPSTLRPHTNICHRYRYIHMDVKGSPTREMWNELFFSIFCWPDVPALASEEFLNDQVRVINAKITEVMARMKEKVDYVNREGLEPIEEVDEEMMVGEQGQEGTGDMTTTNKEVGQTLTTSERLIFPMKENIKGAQKSNHRKALSQSIETSKATNTEHRPSHKKSESFTLLRKSKSIEMNSERNADESPTGALQRSKPRHSSAKETDISDDRSISDLSKSPELDGDYSFEKDEESKGLLEVTGENTIRRRNIRGKRRLKPPTNTS